MGRIVPCFSVKQGSGAGIHRAATVRNDRPPSLPIVQRQRYNGVTNVLAPDRRPINDVISSQGTVYDESEKVIAYFVDTKDEVYLIAMTNGITVKLLDGAFPAPGVVAAMQELLNKLYKKKQAMTLNGPKNTAVQAGQSSTHLRVLKTKSKNAEYYK